MRSFRGEKYGRLTVLDEMRNEKGYAVCLCRCDCGNEKTVYKSNLKSGKTKSCGCLEEENRRKYSDISGKRFGRLTAVSPTDQRRDGGIVWECVCDCGTTAYVSFRNLAQGYTKSCGCIMREKCDITGRRFGRLTALHPDTTVMYARRKWVCQCDCGKSCSVGVSNLKSGHTKSCGCLLHDAEYRTMVEGTCLEVIASPTIPKNNQSGVKGVSYYSRTNSWVATITFQKRPYYLGRFHTIPEAAAARRYAEGNLFVPILRRYRHLLKRKAKEHKAGRPIAGERSKEKR